MSFVDAADFLNAQLARLPQVPRAGTREWTERECWIDPAPIVVLHDGEGFPNPHPHRQCKDVTKTETVTTYAIARVTTTSIEKADEAIFSSPETNGLPEQVRIAKRDYINPTQVEITHASTLEITGQETVGVRLTQSISTTLRRNLTLRGSWAWGSADVGMGIDITTSNSEEQSESHITTVRRSLSDTFRIPPKTSVRIEFLVYESSARIPFTIKAVVDGVLEPNSANLTRASQLLTEEQRTFVMTGYVQATGVSNGQIRITSLPVPIEGETELTISSETREDAHPGLVQFLADKFASPAALTRAGTLLLLDDGPIIGPPDGIHYTVLYTKKVYCPTPQCGFNDLGVMQLGEFDVEVREYTEWRNGVEVRRWNEEVQNFSQCITP